LLKRKCWLALLAGIPLIAFAQSPLPYFTVDNTVRSIHVGASPTFAVISRDGRRVYVANFGGDDLSVIYTPSGEVTSVPVGNHPHGPLLSHDGRHLYVLIEDDDPSHDHGGKAGLAIVDTSDLSVRHVAFPGRSDALAITPDDSRLYITRVDPCVRPPSGIWYLETGTNLLIHADSDLGETPCPVGIAISSDGRHLFVSYQNQGPGGRIAHDAVAEYELPSNRLIKTTGGGLSNVGDQVALSPDGKELWIKGEDACSRPDYPSDGCPSVPSLIVNVLRVSSDPERDMQLLRPIGFSLSEFSGRISFSPRGEVFVGGGIHLKQLRTDGLEAAPPMDIAGAGDVVFSPDGNTAYVTVAGKDEVEVLQRGRVGDPKVRELAKALSPAVVNDTLLRTYCPDGSGLTGARGCSTEKGAYAVLPQAAATVLHDRGVELPGQTVVKPKTNEDNCFAAQRFTDSGLDPQKLIDLASKRRADEYGKYTKQQTADPSDDMTLVDVTGHLAESLSDLAGNLDYRAVYIGVIVCPQQVATVLARQGNPPVVRLALDKDADGRPLTRTELQDAIKDFRADLIDPQSTDPEVSAEVLYHMLLPKEIEHELSAAQHNYIPTQKLTLVWELGDQLRYVPMDALFDGHQYLVKKYSSAILTATSLSSKGTSDTPFVAVAAGQSESVKLHDNYSTEALPNVRCEINSNFSPVAGPSDAHKIQATVLLDKDGSPRNPFTNDTLQRALTSMVDDPNTHSSSQRPIIHIASHFMLSGTADSSFLLTGSGELPLSALADRSKFPFTDAWLVTLSACQTAGSAPSPLAPDMDGSEVESLGYLANQHGAHAVLASLWTIDDASTSALMKIFYDGVKNPTNPNAIKAEALRYAEEQLLDGNLPPERPDDGDACKDADYAPGAYTHPYYWAPFILIGNWD
jgi:YVTN family beta-propeller protein